MSRVFEAFYYIRPEFKIENNVVTNRSAVVGWKFPQGESDNRFVDIPEFCFPDLDQIKLEHMQNARPEHFCFTLTDSNATRYYGVCMRYLPQGEGMRFDVGRRHRVCLCFITHHNYPVFFRTLLLYVHSLLLLKTTDISALLQCVYDQPIPAPGGVVNIRVGSCPVQLAVPLHVTHSHVMSLPLLQRLGSSGLLTLLSVCLNERRIIFTADEVTTLSSSVHACVSLLYPFEWQHIYIPVLPVKLIDYVCAPMPYLIGVKRYMMPQILARPTSDIVIVDVDKGEITTTGEGGLVTFLGNSGTMLRQATEGFERVKHRALKILHTLQQNDAEEQNLAQTSTRDAVAYVLTELKAINFKHTQIKWPGKALVTGKQGDEWQTTAERRLRDTILLFFLYLFHDMDHIVKACDATNTGNRRSGIETYRTRFLESRQTMGDGAAVIAFLKEFVQSQMFERFCERLGEHSTLPENQAQQSDSFDLCRKSLRVAELSPSIPHWQQIIRSVLHDVSSDPNATDKNARADSFYDKLTLALTSNSEPQFNKRQALEQVVARVGNSEHFAKVVKTLWYRLNDCRGGNWKHGSKALALAMELLMSGPEYVLSEVLHFFTEIRALKRYKSNIATAHLQLIRYRAAQCVRLLLDHNLLVQQRRIRYARRTAAAQPTTAGHINKVYDLSSDKWPNFHQLHRQLQPPNVPIEHATSQVDPWSPLIGAGLARPVSEDSPDVSVNGSETDSNADLFGRVSAVDLLLNGQQDEAPQAIASEPPSLDLSDFLQSSFPPSFQTPLRQSSLDPPSDPNTPSGVQTKSTLDVFDWNTNVETIYSSRMSDCSGFESVVGTDDGDIFSVLSSQPTATFTDTLRPPTPDGTFEFQSNFASKPSPAAVSNHQTFSADPFTSQPSTPTKYMDPFSLSAMPELWQTPSKATVSQSPKVTSNANLLDLLTSDDNYETKAGSDTRNDFQATNLFGSTEHVRSSSMGPPLTYQPQPMSPFMQRSPMEQPAPVGMPYMYYQQQQQQMQQQQYYQQQQYPVAYYPQPVPPMYNSGTLPPQQTNNSHQQADPFAELGLSMFQPKRG